MIAREEVDGVMATVAYLTDDFRPASKDNATRVKVLFDDGRIMFGTLNPEEEPSEEEGD